MGWTKGKSRKPQVEPSSEQAAPAAVRKRKKPDWSNDASDGTADKYAKFRNSNTRSQEKLRIVLERHRPRFEASCLGYPSLLKAGIDASPNSFRFRVKLPINDDW